MSTTEARLTANRINALQSTGPTSAEGKAAASRNATRHGLLSTKLFLDDEDPTEFQALLDDLCRSLSPVGAIEATLIERIAVTLWRQRRLVHAETASLALTRQPKSIADGVSLELGRKYGIPIKPEELAPFDTERAGWCRAAMAEIDALANFDLATLEKSAPFVFDQLKSDAEGDREPLAKFVAEYDGGLPRYIAELTIWCREQLSQAASRPHVLAIAEQVRSKRLVLPVDTLEILSRYQTTLDNQMFKLLRGLREVQECRLKTLEASPAPEAGDAPDFAEAA